jgi:hypothetical protein
MAAAAINTRPDLEISDGPPPKIFQQLADAFLDGLPPEIIEAEIVVATSPENLQSSQISGRPGSSVLY